MKKDICEQVGCLRPTYYCQVAPQLKLVMFAQLSQPE